MDKFSKKEIIGITLSLQNKTEVYSNALEEIRKFNEKFVKLEYAINIPKKLNTPLNKRVINMERQCWKNAHYWKRECFEIGGIPRDVFNQDLESKAIKVFNKVCCEISSRDIEAFHSFTNSNNKIIVKSLWWKDCDQVLSVKRDLRKVTLKDVRLRRCNTIFINQIWSR